LCRNNELLQVSNAFFLGEKGNDICNGQAMPLLKYLEFFTCHRQALGRGLFLAERLGWLLLFNLAFECGEFFLELAEVIFLGGHGVCKASVSGSIFARQRGVVTSRGCAG
jgi:hypothetical protein